MFTIIGRRWFEKTNGNTYHSVEVYKDGELLGRVPFAYGYGDQYRQSAFDILVKLGYYKEGEYSKFFLSKTAGDGNLFSVSDVARKKNL